MKHGSYFDLMLCCFQLIIDDFFYIDFYPFNRLFIFFLHLFIFLGQIVILYRCTYFQRDFNSEFDIFLFIIIYFIKQKLMSSKDFKVKEQNHSNEDFSNSIQSKISNEKPQRKSKPRKIIRQNSQKYHWRQKENIKYLVLFNLTLEQKRYIGINKLMSSYIKTRDSVQCHSHHQKIIKKYGDIDQAIAQMTRIYIKKSKYLRKRIENSVKVEEVSLWNINEAENNLQVDFSQKELSGIARPLKDTTQQVKTEQLQQ